MRKFLCTLLCLMLIFTMMPMATGVAFAGAEESYGIWIGSEEVTENKTSGTNWSYNPEKNQLTINGLDITAEYDRQSGTKTYKAGIVSTHETTTMATPLSIIVKGNNNISLLNDSIGIFLAPSVDITIEEGASLTIGTSTDLDKQGYEASGIFMNAIYEEEGYATITNNGTLNIYSADMGIWIANISACIINKGSINVQNRGNRGAIETEKLILIGDANDNLNVNCSDGIGIKSGALTFNNVKADVTSVNAKAICCEKLTLDNKVDIKALGGEGAIKVDDEKIKNDSYTRDEITIAASESTNTNMATSISFASLTDSLSEDTYKYVSIIQPEPLKIIDILPKDFPTSEANAWKNENGESVYISLQDNAFLVGGIRRPMNSYVYKYENDYRLSLDKNFPIYLAFTMESGNLKNITVDGFVTFFGAGNSFEKVDGTYNKQSLQSYADRHSSFDYKEYQAILEQAQKQQAELDAKKAEEEKLEKHEKLVKEAKAVIKKTEFKATSTKQTKLNGKKAVKIKWEVIGGEYDLSDFDGFDVFRSNKKNSGYTKTPFFTTTKWTYTNNKDLKAGKTYYYKVRAWKMVDGEKVYTGWSTKAWRTVK